MCVYGKKLLLAHTYNPQENAQFRFELRIELLAELDANDSIADDAGAADIRLCVSSLRKNE